MVLDGKGDGSIGTRTLEELEKLGCSVYEVEPKDFKYFTFGRAVDGMPHYFTIKVLYNAGTGLFTLVFHEVSGAGELNLGYRRGAKRSKGMAQMIHEVWMLVGCILRGVRVELKFPETPLCDIVDGALPSGAMGMEWLASTGDRSLNAHNARIQRQASEPVGTATVECRVNGAESHLVQLRMRFMRRQRAPGAGVDPGRLHRSVCIGLGKNTPLDSFIVDGHVRVDEDDHVQCHGFTEVDGFPDSTAILFDLLNADHVHGTEKYATFHNSNVQYRLVSWAWAERLADEMIAEPIKCTTCGAWRTLSASDYHPTPVERGEWRCSGLFPHGRCSHKQEGATPAANVIAEVALANQIFTPRDRVYAKYKGKGAFKVGKVCASAGPGRYNITYDDGITEEGVHAFFMRPCAIPASVTWTDPAYACLYCGQIMLNAKSYSTSRPGPKIRPDYPMTLGTVRRMRSTCDACR